MESGRSLDEGPHKGSGGMNGHTSPQVTFFLSIGSNTMPESCSNGAQFNIWMTLIGKANLKPVLWHASVLYIYLINGGVYKY